MKLFLKKYSVWIALGCVILLIWSYAYFYRKIEAFDNLSNATVVSILDKSAGFYSTLFFTLNNYIFCIKNQINFAIKSDEWLFKSQNGWTDYFEDVKLTFYENDQNNQKEVVRTSMGDYPLHDYKNTLPSFYVYNQRTLSEIEKTKNQFNLIDGEYDGIFIRRGDKLGQESRVLSEDMYLNLLLKKNPHCKVIFVQTDDYNSYVAIQELVKSKNLNIAVHTLCDPNSGGVVVHNFQKNILNEAVKTNEANKEYLAGVIDKLNASKSVEEMNSEEIYKHSMDMIVGLDVLINSNICITDYQSNVSRFIKLAHKRPENVYDVMNPQNDIDYNKIANPAYGF